MNPKKKLRTVSGNLTIRAASNDPDGLLITDKKGHVAFKKSVESPKVLGSSGSGFTLTKIESCNQFMSQCTGDQSTTHRVHQIIAMYPVTLTLDPHADLKRVAEEFTLFAMWQVKGLNPTSFSVMLCTDDFEVVTAGDLEPDVEGEVQNG